MEMTSTRPYLLRALHEWILDNGMTPHLLVDAEHEQVQVPKQFVEDGAIVLNMSTTAVRHLMMTNDEVSFSARFSGTPFEIYVPMTAVKAIYAKENGRGMVFQEEELEAESAAAVDSEKKETQPKTIGRPTLTLVE